MSGKRQKIQYSLALEPVDQGETPVSGYEGTEPFVAKPTRESPASAEQLMEEVCKRENLVRAWKRVRSNQGGPGVDGLTIDDATHKPVERFCEFINVPELIDMFRSVADVVLKNDLHGCLALPRIKGGQRQLITAEASEAFRDWCRAVPARGPVVDRRRCHAETLGGLELYRGCLQCSHCQLPAAVASGLSAGLHRLTLWTWHPGPPLVRMDVGRAALGSPRRWLRWCRGGAGDDGGGGGVRCRSALSGALHLAGRRCIRAGSRAGDRHDIQHGCRPQPVRRSGVFDAPQLEPAARSRGRSGGRAGWR